MPIPLGVLVIADDLRSVLPLLRQQAESLMVTPCTITRQGEPVDDGTGNYIPAEVLVFDGLCQVSGRESQVLDLSSGSADVDALRAVIKVPVSAGPFKRGDIVRTPGRVFRVEGPDERSWQKSQRLPVLEVI